MLSAWGDISPLFRSHFFDGQHDAGARRGIVVGGLGFPVAVGPICGECLGVASTVVVDWQAQFPALTADLVPWGTDVAKVGMLWCAECGWDGTDRSRHDCRSRRARWAVPR